MNVLINKFDDEDELLKNISIVENVDLDDQFKVELKNEGLINKIFERKVNENPEKVILYTDDGEFTYEQLNKKANKIANALIKRGLKTEDRVMLMMRRNSDLIASVLGTVKAGGAFIPVDPNYPKHRIEWMLEDSESKFVITNKDVEYDGENGIRVSELLEEEDDTNPQIELTPDNLCFLIFTSGSTGRPKGVMITHKGISNYIACHPENVPIYELNRKCTKFVSISMISFIVFLREIFGTMLNGLPLVFTNDEQLVNPLELYKLFKKHNADAFGGTPTRLIEYLSIKEIQDMVKDCKVIIVGGEGFPPILYEKLSKYTDADIYNSYGPTEVTIASHYKLIDSTEVTAGWKMLNVVDKIMDIDANQLPPYVPGEVYVGGAGVARGYINNPEQTRKVFLNINGIPYYNTGDLCKKDEYGELYVLGRNDGQIKLRGLRIEPSEIETIIAKFNGILITKVQIKNVNSTDYLCAYFTATEKINIEKLKQHLLDNLPKYMLPTFFIQLDSFPKTPNGKTDFKNLPDPEFDTEEFIEPKTDTEKEVFSIVSELLGHEEFGINTDLFTVGLTSLSVVQLVSSIYEKFGTQLMVTEVMKYRSIEKIVEHINVEDEEVVDVQEYYPLTQNQLGVYFECLKNPDKLSYNLPKRIDFGFDVDSQRLKDSIVKAINNHPYLKTAIVMRDGTVYQQRRDDLKVDDLIEIVDEYDFNDFVEAFKLEEGPLFRFKIVGNSLFADFHHIIVDGTSLNILFDEITKIYDGKDYVLEQIDGYQYCQNEIKTEQSMLYKEAELFFNNKIKEFDEATIITQDLNGDALKGKSSNVRSFIDISTVNKFCSNLNISPNNLFLAVSTFVLSKFVYKKELLIATITNGRFNPNEQRTLAMMVKTLPLAVKLNSDLTIGEFFEYVNNEWLDILTYSSYPLTKIANDFDITPEVLYAFHGKIIEDLHINGQTVERKSIDYDSLKFKINLSIVEVEDKYRITCEYNDQLYSKELMETFINSITIVLNKFMNLNNDTRLKDISIIENDNWGIDETHYKDIGECRLNKLFEKQVELHPNKIALHAADGDFSYEELNIKANKIANYLNKKGVGIEDKVMIVLNRNSNFIASVFGILKAGAAFIAIDSDYPKDRIEHVLTDSQSKYILVDDITDKKGIDLSDYSDNLLDINEVLLEDNVSNPNPDLSYDNLAYLIYTSGSTGLPKGVMLEHRNLANLVYPDEDNIYTYELVKDYEKENYKILATTTVAFDPFLQELMIPLLNGIPIVFASDDEYKDSFAMVELIKKTGANVYNGTPSRLLQYLEIDEIKDVLYSFKAYIIGGEPFPSRLYDMLEENSNAKIFNAYGPSETTIDCNIALLGSNDITVGRPLLNVVEYIMDLDSNPLPPNVMGELYIGGRGVSREYLNRPEKNAESYATINGIKFFKAGDYAKRNNDGTISIFGRLDNQIKLRGLRIEIGEIESVISKYEPIKSVAVVVRKIKGNDHLCAYFTVHDKFKNKHLNENEYSFDIDDLKEKLGEKLVYYMVPTIYMELDEMPQTPNGKTDLKNLPEPVLITQYVAPENDTEAFFAKTFADILGLDEVSVTDNFFEIGGTSLLVTKITVEALNRGYKLNYGDVFTNPTPRKLADFITSDKKVKVKEENRYDYSQINKILAKNTLDSFVNGEKSEDLGNILLTGATGFLGIHILKELIENEPGEIYCFVRSKGDLTGAQRLKTLLFYYFSENYEQEFDTRIHVINGDITNFEDFEKLIPYKIDTLFNCAANVKHFSSGTDIEDINLGGVVNGLKFARMKNIKYVQVSTTSVAGESIDNYPPLDVNFTENDLYTGQTSDNQYIISKFLAERAVLEAAVNDDLDVKIMRVGNLMARSSDSEFQINFESNGFINRLKAFVTIGKIPYSMLSNNVEFSQIDITAKSIIELAKTPKECVVFHPYNRHNISYADVIDIIRPLSLNIEATEDDDYKEALNESLNDKSKQDGIGGLITSIGSGTVKKDWVPVDNYYTTQALYRMGINWPLISEEYVYNFVKYLDELNFFN
ncbi:MAG: hypothetical protein BZ135_08700, partial [Methanosphaera sp. rholeuAM6]